jgi:hypothetical protein
MVTLGQTMVAARSRPAMVTLGQTMVAARSLMTVTTRARPTRSAGLAPTGPA